jgi:hypothetical protein
MHILHTFAMRELNMNISVADFHEDSLGWASMVTVEPALPVSPDLMDESVRMLRAPLLTFVLDSSGSMERNIDNAKVALLALVDAMPNGSTLRVIMFDTRCVDVLSFPLMSQQLISPVTRDTVKKELREKLTCLGGGTNIELPLVDMLSTSSLICFVSDGMANVGFNTTSESLLAIARRCPGYKDSIINTLGIQFDPSVSLNAKLLKDLAEDSGGIFTIARDSEMLKTFVGQILGTYYFQRGTFKISLRSSNGLEAECDAPPGGWRLRADKSTKILFKWNQQPTGKRVCITHARQPGNSLTQLPVSSDEDTEITYVDPHAPNADEEFRIVAALVSPYLGQHVPKAVRMAVEKLSQHNPSLIPLVVALSRGPIEVDSPAYVNLSRQAYDYSSMGGGELTPALISLGEYTQHLSQGQNPH